MTMGFMVVLLFTIAALLRALVLGHGAHGDLEWLHRLAAAQGRDLCLARPDPLAILHDLACATLALAALVPRAGGGQAPRQ